MEKIMGDNVMALTEAAVGSVVRLCRVEAGDGLKQHLASLGIVGDVEMRVVRNEGKGLVIVNVKDSKIVLGRGMSNKVMVR